MVPAIDDVIVEMRALLARSPLVFAPCAGLKVETLNRSVEPLRLETSSAVWAGETNDLHSVRPVRRYE